MSKTITPELCSCIACQQGMDGLEEFEHAAAQKYGWWAHILTDKDPDSPTGFNMHTHGLAEFWRHRDLQCVFPHIRPAYVMAIWEDIIRDVKGGQQFLPDVDYPGYIQDGYMVRFIEAEEGGRTVLRMLIPNKEGKYEAEDGCTCYANQLNP